MVIRDIDVLTRAKTEKPYFAFLWQLQKEWENFCAKYESDYPAEDCYDPRNSR
jgi:hypothetical protein